MATKESEKPERLVRDIRPPKRGAGMKRAEPANIKLELAPDMVKDAPLPVPSPEPPKAVLPPPAISAKPEFLKEVLNREPPKASEAPKPVPEDRDSVIRDFFSRKENPPAPKAPPKPETALLREPEIKIHAWKPARRLTIQRSVIAGAVVGVLAAAFLLLSTIFARATISIQPLLETAVLSPILVTVTPDAKAIDLKNNLIPGEVIEFTETRETKVAASGKKTVSEKARGKISILNSYGTEPQILVEKTRFQSPDGKIFRLDKSVTVPGARAKNGGLEPSSIEASVTADLPGEQYNLDPATFTIPGFKGTPRYQGFTGKSARKFSGGFQGEATVASDADIKQGTEKVTADLFNQLREDLSGKIPAGFSIIDGAREIAITNIEVPTAAVAGDAITITASGKVRAVAFRQSDETDFIAGLFSTSTAKMLISEKSELSRQGVTLDQGRKLSFTLSGTAALGRRLDADALGEEVRGKGETELQGILSGYGGIQSYRLKIFPFWLKTVPAEAKKVHIEIRPFES